jgi:hypothetical protein
MAPRHARAGLVGEAADAELGRLERGPREAPLDRHVRRAHVAEGVEVLPGPVRHREQRRTGRPGDVERVSRYELWQSAYAFEPVRPAVASKHETGPAGRALRRHPDLSVRRVAMRADANVASTAAADTFDTEALQCNVRLEHNAQESHSKTGQIGKGFFAGIDLEAAHGLTPRARFRVGSLFDALLSARPACLVERVDDLGGGSPLLAVLSFAGSVRRHVPTLRPPGGRVQAVVRCNRVSSGPSTGRTYCSAPLWQRDDSMNRHRGSCREAHADAWPVAVALSREA